MFDSQKWKQIISIILFYKHMEVLKYGLQLVWKGQWIIIIMLFVGQSHFMYVCGFAVMFQASLCYNPWMHS